MFTLFVLSGVLGSSVFAQHTDRPHIVQRRRLHRAQGNPVSRNDPAGSQSSRSSNSPGLSRAEHLAARLSRDSQAAFDRGLMPLADYADHLAVARHLKVTAAELREDEAARKAAIAEHAARLNRAVERLEAFNQPNAQGYQGELLHAKFLAAQAEAAVAKENNDRGGTIAAARRAEHFAAQHIRARTAEYQTGRATLPQLVRALSDAAQPGGSAAFADDDAQVQPEGLAAVRNLRHDRIQDIAAQMERLAQHGAEGVREDQLKSLQFSLARLKVSVASAAGQDEWARSAIQEAERHSRQLFDTQRDFYKHGTASLFDVTRAWWLRYQLHREAEEAETDVSETVFDRRRADLDRLTQLAEGIADRRGRLSADVTLVDGLRTLQQLNDAQAAAANAVEEPERSSVPQKAEADSTPYVIEFNN